MRKLICLLVLCLCLNGAVAGAEEGAAINALEATGDPAQATGELMQATGDPAQVPEHMTYDEPTADPGDITEGESMEDPGDITEDDPMEDPGDITEDESMEDPGDITEDESMEDPGDITEDDPMEDPEDITEDESMEDPEDITEDYSEEDPGDIEEDYTEEDPEDYSEEGPEDDPEDYTEDDPDYDPETDPGFDPTSDVEVVSSGKTLGELDPIPKGEIVISPAPGEGDGEPDGSGESPKNPEGPTDSPENPGDNPDNPGEPTDPGDNPDNPDNPGEPTDPGDNPDNPGEPTDPGDNPDNPGESTDPGDNPDNPGESTEPGDNGDNPGEPTDPGDNPDNPGESTVPDAPGDIGENPDNPTDPANPDNPTDPENPDNPTDPADPDNPTDPDPASPEDPSALSADGDAWFERDGWLVSGSLREVAERLVGGETVYLRTWRVQCLPDAPLRLLSVVDFLPDEAVFSEAEHEVRMSFEDPSEAEEPALVTPEALAQRGEEERETLYLWVAPADQEPPAGPGELDGPVIEVWAEDFIPGVWSAATPTFTLSGIPEGESWIYAAIIYDERIIPLSEDFWTAEREGLYTVRFAILDGIGDIVSASEKYTLWLDHTPPEDVDIAPAEDADYTLTVTASDSMSGVAGVSLDGGASWISLTDDTTYTYASDRAVTFPAGAIQVIDLAGNIAQSESEITIDKRPRAASYSSGSGGGGGASAPAKTHASGDGEVTPAYDTVALKLPSEPMTRLTLGGEELELTLTLLSAQEAGAPVGTAQPFTASLGRWRAPEGEGDPRQDDTLILSAQPREGLGEAFTYEWRFNGEVYRTLANSGVKYVALRVGDDLAAFPTEGFTGGTKYTELKMLGVSTRRFDYAVDMRVNRREGYVSTLSDCDFSADCDLSIRTEVENMAYELSSSPQSVMYFYDVYLGPEEMLEYPFGEYAGDENTIQ